MSPVGRLLELFVLTDEAEFQFAKHRGENQRNLFADFQGLHLNRHKGDEAIKQTDNIRLDRP